MSTPPAGRAVTARTASDLANTHVVAFVMGELGADRGPVHLEDLTFHCWNRYRARFSYPKYPDHMNVVVARTALVDLRREGLAEAIQTADGLTQFRLTVPGRTWVDDNKAAISAALRQQSRDVTSKAMDKSAFGPARARLSRSGAARKWLAGQRDAITVWDFFEATRIDTLESDDRARSIIAQLRMAVDGDPDLEELTNFLDEKFGNTYRSLARPKQGV